MKTSWIVGGAAALVALYLFTRAKSNQASVPSIYGRTLTVPSSNQIGQDIAVSGSLLNSFASLFKSSQPTSPDVVTINPSISQETVGVFDTTSNDPGGALIDPSTDPLAN